MNISICQLCKEPIWSFICPHCLAREIGRWLPSRAREAFGKFNENFFSNFSATIDVDGLRCLRCRKVRLANICLFCYLAEVYDWLCERERNLAEAFFRMMPHRRSFDVSSAVVSWKRSAIPISATGHRETDEGICEICERYSDSIAHDEGRWLCRDCEDLGR